VRETPAQQLTVARRDEEAGAGERRRRGDERLQILVRLADGVSEPPDVRRVSRDATAALHQARGSLVNCFQHLAGPVVPVNPQAESITGGQISLRGRANVESGKMHP